MSREYAVREQLARDGWELGKEPTVCEEFLDISCKDWAGEVVQLVSCGHRWGHSVSSGFHREVWYCPFYHWAYFPVLVSFRLPGTPAFTGKISRLDLR